MEIRNKDFLITGGGSQIGSHLAERLLESGAKRIVLFDNLSLGSLENLGSLVDDDRVQFVHGDILRPAQLLEACEGVDGVFAMAALLTLPLSKDPSLGLQVNINGLINTLDACRFSNVKKCILASSIAVYGDEIEQTTVEETPFGSSSLAPPFALYGLSKLAGEQLGKLYAQRYDVEFSAVRFSTVYGERQHTRGVNALHIIEAYKRIVEDKPPIILGDGSEAHDYLHVTDASEASVRAMVEGGSGEAYTIATGVSTTITQLVELVLRECGSNLSPEFRVDDRPHRATIHSHLDLNIEKARVQLGWMPQVSLEQGVHNLLDWSREYPDSGMPSGAREQR